MMKTYAECEQETRALLASALSETERGNIALRLEMATNLAVSHLYQAELLRDQSNTAEMHQLLERLQGDQHERLQAGDVTNFGKTE